MLLGFFHWRRLDMGYVVTFTLFFFREHAPLASWWGCHISVACGGFFSPTFPEEISMFSNKTVTFVAIYPKQLFIVHCSTLLFSKLLRSLVEPSGYINCEKCLVLKCV